MVSVCMATFNGEKFIREQIGSILVQLDSEDELIISDDGSTDSTLDVICSITDRRIKIYKNSFKNVVHNFEFAISKATGDYIFLSDQDDRWHEDKIKSYLECFDITNADLVISDVALIDSGGGKKLDRFYPNGFKMGTFENLKKNNFIGCAMAFKRHTKQWFIPFPNNIPMHDWWIGLVISKKGKVKFLDKKLIYYRRHGENVTTGMRSSFWSILRWRWILIKNLYLQW